MQRDFKISLSQEYYSDTVYLSQYDSDYDIVFNVMDKYASATSIDGMSAKFMGTRSDSLGFQYTTTASGSTATFTIDTALTALSGTCTAEVVFYDENDLYFGSANVQVVIEPATHTDDTVDADVTAQQTLLEEIQEAVDNAAASVTSTVGDLSDLTTTDQSSVVAAINEVDADVSQLNAEITAISNSAFPSTAKVLLISLFRNATFLSDQTDVIDALDTALNVGDIVAVTGITLDSASKSVTAGSTVTITPTVTPSNATNKGITWTSSDESVATVSGGVVTGVGSGTAVITATTLDGGYSATCSVTSTIVNLLDTADSSVSNYVNRDTGALASSDTFDATDYIWLEPNTTYYSEGCYLENFYAFYNSSKVYVSSPPSSVTITSESDRNWGAHRKGTIVTGSQGYYFRGSYNKTVAYTPYIALAPIE